MGIFSKKEKATQAYKFLMVDGIPSIEKGMTVRISLMPDRIQIQQIMFGKAEASLRYDQVTAAAKVDETQIREVDKSVIGRAIVGGILLGPLGAIVGGASGIGKKQKTEYKDYFVINYTASSGEPAVLSFEMVGPPIGFDPFLRELKARAGIPETLAAPAGPTVL